MASRVLSDYEITCVVSCIPDKDCTGDNNTRSCSAVFLSPKHVLVPGCILPQNQDDVCRAPDIKFEILAKYNSQMLESKKAKLVTLWECNSLLEAVNSLFLNSDIAPRSDSDHDDVDICQLVTFLILEICEDRECYHMSSNLINLGQVGELNAFMDIVSCCTPFGNNYAQEFFNSWTSGLVSKAIDMNNSLFLADLACMPGGQGGIVYESTRMVAVGIIVHPVIWRQDEYTGLSIIASLPSIVKSLHSHSCSINTIPQYIKSLDLLAMQPHHYTLPVKCTRLVRIQHGTTWGSGILLSANYVITCSHVIKDKISNAIYVHTNCEVIRATVLYTSSNIDAFDVAVLKLQRPVRNITGILSVKEAEVGMHVQAEGFGIFQHDSKPIVSKGIISKIAKVEPGCHHLLTTCKTHSGSSGGAITDQSNNAVGMITSNVHDSTNNICYTNLGFAISLHNMYPIIKLVCATGDVSGFLKLEAEMGSNNGFFSLKSKL